MKRLEPTTVLAACLCAAALVLATGCPKEEETPGEKIEDAMDDAGDAVEDAAEDVGDAVDDAGS